METLTQKFSSSIFLIAKKATFNLTSLVAFLKRVVYAKRVRERKSKTTPRLRERERKRKKETENEKEREEKKRFRKIQ